MYKRMLNRLEDWLLAIIQRRCTHSDPMVAVDILEGMMDNWHVSYCRRCGAVRPEPDYRLIEGHLEWRLPDPYLWKNFKRDLEQNRRTGYEVAGHMNLRERGEQAIRAVEDLHEAHHGAHHGR